MRWHAAFFFLFELMDFSCLVPFSSFFFSSSVTQFFRSDEYIFNETCLNPRDSLNKYWMSHFIFCTYLSNISKWRFLKNSNKSLLSYRSTTAIPRYLNFIFSPFSFKIRFFFLIWIIESAFLVNSRFTSFADTRIVRVVPNELLVLFVHAQQLSGEMEARLV